MKRTYAECVFDAMIQEILGLLLNDKGTVINIRNFSVRSASYKKLFTEVVKALNLMGIEHKADYKFGHRIRVTPREEIEKREAIERGRQAFWAGADYAAKAHTYSYGISMPRNTGKSTLRGRIANQIIMDDLITGTKK